MGWKDRQSQEKEGMKRWTGLIFSWASQTATVLLSECYLFSPLTYGKPRRTRWIFYFIWYTQAGCLTQPAQLEKGTKVQNSVETSWNMADISQRMHQWAALIGSHPDLWMSSPGLLNAAMLCLIKGAFTSECCSGKTGRIMVVRHFWAFKGEYITSREEN